MYSVPVRKSKRREKNNLLHNFQGNYSIYEVKNCHNAETIRQFPHFLLSKKNSFRFRENTVNKSSIHLYVPLTPQTYLFVTGWSKVGFTGPI